MTEPKISNKFDVADIRALREYNSLRHIDMETEEIILETKSNAAAIILELERMRQRKV